MSAWLTIPQRLPRTLEGLGLLALRVWLAQEFLQAGWIKLSAGWQAPEWFSQLAFPGPLAWLPANVNWVSAGMLEVLGGLAVLLGWQTRLAACALLFVTYVAVATVHFDLGWAGWNQIDTEAGQGFKVPLMLAAMLWTLLCQGAGRWALDARLSRAANAASSP